ncbi:kinase-like domain-containing protein [Lactarius pseudohatsudake]|nr:kinase-like domain-containing protein [Lactarius pseudohatsudake]
MDFTHINGVYRLQRKIGSGSFEGGFNAMALNLLGQSLEDLFVSRHFNFTVHTVLLLADQLVCRLKYIHSRNFIHHDLKPSNIVIGLGTQANIVYLINFGLSKEYRDPYTNKHIPPDTNLGLTGMATFASINSHLGLELGWRDDMESLAYIIIYFLRGHLPWQGLPSFEKKPDYGYISSLFNDLSLQEGFQHDSAFDWDGTNNEQPHNSPAKGTVWGRHGQPLRRREGYVTFLFMNFIALPDASTKWYHFDLVLTSPPYHAPCSLTVFL